MCGREFGKGFPYFVTEWNSFYIYGFVIRKPSRSELWQPQIMKVLTIPPFLFYTEVRKCRKVLPKSEPARGKIPRAQLRDLANPNG